MSLCSYTQSINIQIGECILIENHPCKISAKTTSKTGKHGGCKIHFTGSDIFTGKKYITTISSTENVEVPEIVRTEYQLIDINNENPPFLTLLSVSGETKEDLILPDNNLGKNINEDFKNSSENILVTVLKSMNSEMIISHRINK